MYVSKYLMYSVFLFSVDMFSIAIVISLSIYWGLDFIEVRFVNLILILFIDLVNVSQNIMCGCS